MKNMISNYLSPEDFDQFIDHEFQHEAITEQLPAQRNHADDEERSIFRRFRNAQLRAERSLKF